MLAHRQISPAEHLIAGALPRITEAARKHLSVRLGFEPSPAHLDDIVQDLIESDPSVLATYIAHPDAPENDAGLTGIVRSALDARQRARPYLFEPLCSRAAFLKTAAAERLGTAEPSEKQMLAIANEFDLSGADGVEGLRRSHCARCERLEAAHKRELIARDGHSRGAAGVFTDPNDPRTAAARGAPGSSAVSGVPTVAASRSQLPTRGVIAGGPKPKIATTPLFDPDGKLHEVPVTKAGDYERLRGWRRPINVVAHPTGPAPVPETEEDAAAPAPVAPPAPPAPAQTVSTLAQLREEAAALGIDVSANWGLARLRAEIAAVATSTSTASPDDAQENRHE